MLWRVQGKKNLAPSMRYEGTRIVAAGAYNSSRFYTRGATLIVTICPLCSLASSLHRCIRNDSDHFFSGFVLRGNHPPALLVILSSTVRRSKL